MSHSSSQFQSMQSSAEHAHEVDRLVAKLANQMVEDLHAAVSIPSVNPARVAALPDELRSRAEAQSRPGERAFQHVLADFAAAKGLGATLTSTPDADRPNLEVRLGCREDMASLLLNSHCDVVPAVGEGWHTPPFAPTIARGSMVGRGAADAKGSLIAMLEAMWIVRRIVGEEIGEVTLTSVVDEEAGGSGTMAWIEDRRRTDRAWPDAAIVGEPTSLDVCPATRGARSFRLEVAGVGAHAGEAYLGINAIDEALAYIDAIRRVHVEASKDVDASLWPKTEPPCVFNLGALHGGDTFASVPETCVAEGVVGWIPPRTLDDMTGRVEEALAGVAAVRSSQVKHPPDFRWTLVGFEASATDPSHPLVSSLSRSARRVRRGSSVRGLSAGTDMRHLVRLAGIPTVNFGPGSMSQGHAVNESLPIDQFLDAVRSLAFFILSWGLAPKKASHS